MTDSKWQALSAVKDERVYMLPVGISRWGHPNSLEIPLAMMFTSKMMYPELFEDLNMKDEMFYFYKTFFDIEMDDEMMTSILEGDGMRIRKDEK
jgi:iron complex transport system substrate-binding protein